MLKIKLFNSKHPIEHQELEISDHRLKGDGCSIGSSPACGLVLPSMKVQEIHGKLFIDNGQYYFRDMTKVGHSQVNDEEITLEHPYSLETDDIIRIGEFVLIIDGLPLKGKSKYSKSKSRRKNADSRQTSNQRPRKSLQAMKSLALKNRRSSSTTSENPKTSLNKETSVSVNTPSATVSQIITPIAVSSSPIPKVDTPTVLETPPLDGINWWTKGDLTVRCLSVIEETQDVKTFRFVGTSPVLFNYKPGQFVTLKLNIVGKTIKRAYSISSTPSRPHTLEITVKRVPPPSDVPDAPPGLVSNWLHDNISVGSEISLSGPSGKFTCVDNNHPKLLFISAGSGITPMMSMSRWALDTGAQRDIIFFHSARSPQDIIFRRELEVMTAQHPNFHLALTMTRASLGEPWWGFTGRLTDKLLEIIAPDFQERMIYVCGPDTFMKGVKTLVEGMGFPMVNYHQESFGGSKKASSTPTASTTVLTPPTSVKTTPVSPGVPKSSNETHTVVFAQSKKEVKINANTSILETAEEAMIEVNSSCRSGGCGTCKIKKLEGEIRYEGEPDGLDPSERNQGYILGCIAYPTGRVIIDI
ncbi:2Fe-2S iron-sulfur cluster-binding protein [Aphanothece sacrum]|uniref:Ferredoxin--NADP reductase n=1 Tax=Aphanothece sacrum FPU1 TaxID=1920663 RepID=A0A401IFE6_APHSA|nr:2Fe-2S iron-sulfur cluster-binding protein [Aphanothece sacrum]GBF79929.1 ferredoxin [Aphanothece sacrum FPU1]GBF83851.1 ferredoxin [Aphanothece sacrum FPU3]